MSSRSCPLCLCENSEQFHYQEQHKRDFFKCSQCELVFVDRNQLASPQDEKSRYTEHNNSDRTPGYEKFLSRLIDPIERLLPERSVKGLDFGEGPYPMMRELFYERGYQNISGHDPYFNPNHTKLLDTYDFVTCCEVIEHMSRPHEQIKGLVGLLKEKGLLVISTGVLSSAINFPTWHYIKDVTHINFFSQNTFKWMEDELDLKIIEQSRDLIVFSKR